MGGKKREKGSSLFYFLSLSLSLLEMSALTPPTVENMKKQAMAVLEEMLIDRGYHLTYVDRDLTQSESYYIKATHTDDQQWMLVFLNDEEKVNIASIKDRIVVMNREAASRCILVYRSSVTSTAKKASTRSIAKSSCLDCTNCSSISLDIDWSRDTSVSRPTKRKCSTTHSRVNCHSC